MNTKCHCGNVDQSGCRQQDSKFHGWQCWLQSDFHGSERHTQGAFRVPGAMGLFEYMVMTFVLKNAGATYQRAMNYMYHDLISKLVEIYINALVVKSTSIGGTWGIYAKFLSEPGGSDTR
jgi:hypothetical protein